MQTKIHPTAIVNPGAELGDNIEIGPYVVIDDKVKIAEGVRIGPHAVIHKFTSIAKGCVIHAHAVLGDLPQDLAYKDNVSYVRIGPGTAIREGVTIHRGTKPDTTTEVGANCFLMANSHLAHNVSLGNNVTLANGALLAGYVEVGERAFVSGNCVIHQFVRIGRMAMLGGNSGISKDVPPFCMARSVALNVIAGLNVVGLRRAGINAADRLQIKHIFAVLYKSGLNIGQAVARLKSEAPRGPDSKMSGRGILAEPCEAKDAILAKKGEADSPYVQEIIRFIESSKRGICGFASGQEDG